MATTEALRQKETVKNMTILLNTLLKGYQKAHRPPSKGECDLKHLFRKQNLKDKDAARRWSSSNRSVTIERGGKEDDHFAGCTIERLSNSALPASKAKPRC